MSRRPDWPSAHPALDADGFALIREVLSVRRCRDLAGLFGRDERFRSTVVMEHVGYGRGRYRYFDYPLPRLVDELRHEAYEALAPLANRWCEALGRDVHYPARLDAFLERCHRAGQTRPTPLLLRYGKGDFNRLHQDVYGPLAFPLQLLIPLSQHREDYDGGEVILLEQRPRMQSRATAIIPGRGDALVFTNKERPVVGKRGAFRVQMRHGASEIRRGERLVLGIIFHDAL